MKNKKELDILFELDKIFIKNNISNINNMINKDKDLHSYKDIRSMNNIYEIYNETSKLYKKVLKLTLKKFSYIKEIKGKQNKRKIVFKRKRKIHDELFFQVEAIMAFFVIDFKPNTKLVMSLNYDYHSYIMLFIYLYSIFDVVSALIYSHYFGQNLSKYELSVNLKQVKFSDPNSYLKQNTELKKEIQNLLDSKVFQYIRILRNSWSHQFQNPMMKYHFSIDMMFCFIVICHLADIINKHLE